MAYNGLFYKHLSFLTSIAKIEMPKGMKFVGESISE